MQSLEDGTRRSAPTLEGTLSYVHDDLLKAIAADFNCPVSSLATLTVNEAIEELFKAVREYAALCPPPDPDMYNPLHVSDFVYKHKKVKRRKPKPSYDGTGSKRTTHATLPRIYQQQKLPKFFTALGTTAILWPPPPHLTARRLYRIRRQEHRAEEAEQDSADDSSQTILKNPDDQLGNSRSVDSTNDAWSSASSSSSLSEEGKGSDDGYLIINIVHYVLGFPKGSSIYGPETHEEVMLSSPDGAAVLRMFARQIMIWITEKNWDEGDNTKISIRRFKTRHGSGRWRHAMRKPARPPSSVILPNDLMNKVLEDVGNFVKPATKEWYRLHGLAYRRAYLFYGPPGTGKTSTIRAIATEFGLRCYFLSLTDEAFSNQILADALSRIGSDALLVLEDVDSLVRADRIIAPGCNLTFSGLLNALDGLISADGVITVMTTNHIDRLDGALIRGGRVDKRFMFPAPGSDEIKHVFRAFYPGAKEELAQKFLEKVLDIPEAEEARSISTLQQLFIDQRESSAEECVESAPGFFKEYFAGNVTCKANAPQRVVSSAPVDRLEDGTEIWKGKLRISSHADDTAIDCAALTYAVEGRQSLLDSKMWPSEFLIKDSVARGSSSVLRMMNNPVAQWYVRFTVVDESENSGSRTRLLNLMQRMINRDEGYKIDCTTKGNSGGMVYIWAKPVPSFGLSLLGGFVASQGPSWE